MPNHLHLFLALERDSLRSTLTEFKRWTGHQAAELLSLQGHSFWHREWFDHWSRSEGEDSKIVKYIFDNPAKARLVSDSREWPHASWARR
jgi:REP element-mobilizing transposase RayT